MRKVLIILLLLLSVNVLDVHASEYIEGIEEGYEGTSINVEAEGYTIYIDGLLYNQGTTYSNVGHHVMSVYQEGVLMEEINFTIHPHLGTRINVLGQTVMEDELFLQLNNKGTIVCFINLEKTKLPVTIEEVGYYHVMIFGENGYVKEYNFTVVDSTLEELTKNEVSPGQKIDPEAFIELEINGQIIEEEFEFENYGYYHIKATGVNGYVYNNQILIDIPSTVIENKEYESITIKDDHALEVKINGELIDADKKLIDVGYYTISYRGEKNYYREFYITIVEDEIRIEEGAVLDEFSIKDLHADLFLNGERYIPNTKITTLGYYEFVIKGVGGYEKTLNFSILRDLPFNNRQKLREPTNIDVDVVSIKVNGQEQKIGYRIHETGTYKIQFIGAGGYTEELTVSYINPNDDYFPIFNYVAYGLSGIVVLIYGIIFWRRSR